MKKKWIRLISVVMLVAMMPMLVGCQEKKEASVELKPMEKEESYAVSFDFLGGKDVMPIGGYFGPHLWNYSWNGNELPDYFSDETFGLFAEAGVNLITYSQMHYAKYPEAIRKILEQGEKFGIGYLPQDELITDKQGEKILDAAQTGKRLIDLFDYPSYCGVFVIDEPSSSYYLPGDGTRDISRYGKIAEVVNEELGLKSYTNLYPMEDYTKDLENYERYVKEFCDTLKPNILIWDYYPFQMRYKGDMKGYFLNMGIVKKNAQENKIPFWASIQAGDQWGGGVEPIIPYWPNEAQFNWNVNTCLAYGVQGFQYYSLIGTSGSAVDNNGEMHPYKNGIVGALNNKTQWFYYSKNITKHIAAIDEVLMNCASKGVLVKGEQANRDCEGAYDILEGESFRELQSIEGDAMVGCFNYNGKTALYVVNYSMEYAQRITLKFDKEHKFAMTQLAETSYVKGDTLTLDMAAGEGILLVIE